MKLFTTGGTNVEEVMNCIGTKITDNQNIHLMLPITREEVSSALFQMHPDKAPGPNGMTPAFFQKYWSILGDDIVELTRKFFETGEIIKGLNETNIILIPKKRIRCQ